MCNRYNNLVRNMKRNEMFSYSALCEEETYDELFKLDWVGIPNKPYVIKSSFDENGYMLMVSDLVAVYAEKLEEKAIHERFTILNPFIDILPKIILKRLKQSVNKILTCEQALEEAELKISLDSNKAIIEHRFLHSGVSFLFNFEPQKLSEYQFKAHILRPALHRALNLDEEKAVLQRKLQELEGKQNSSSSCKASDSKQKKDIYFQLMQKHTLGAGVINAFLYLQKTKHKEKLTVPESLEDTPYDLPKEETQLLQKKIKDSKNIAGNIPYEEDDLPKEETQLLQKKIKDSKNIAGNIPYEEDDSEIKLDTQNKIPLSKEPEIPLKIEKMEKEKSLTNEFDDSSNNLTMNNEEQSNKCLSAMKRELEEVDSKEEGVSKPAPYLKPSSSKMQKLFNL